MTSVQANETGTPIVVAVALSARDWRGVLQRHCRDHVADVVVVPVRDGRDALERSAELVVVDDDTSWLSAPFVVQARERGVVLVGLYDPLEADGHGRTHLGRLGIDHVVPATADVDELLNVIRRVRPSRRSLERFEHLTADLDDRVPGSRRTVVAVGGPAGAGATEVSIALAAHWPERPSLLIDVDETHPSMSRRLGLGIHPHLISAIEAHRGEQLSVDGSLDAVPDISDCLATRAVPGPGFGFDVIVGLAARDDWSLVRSGEVVDLVEELSARWPAVVARIGPQLEDLSRHVDRFGQSRAVAAQASHIVAVCDASPTGLLRFVDWLIDLLPLVGDTPVHVVLNRVPRSASMRNQLEQQLHEIAGPRLGAPIAVPHDRRVERAAWDANVATNGAMVRAIKRLAASLAADPHVDAAITGAEQEAMVA